MTTRRSLVLAAALLPLLALVPTSAGAEVASAKGITVAHSWVRATPGGAKVGAGYMTIAAAPGSGDTLVSASSDVAGRTELHTHIMEGDVMKMRQVDKIEIASGATVLFQPSGFHVMLIDLKQPLKQGDRVKITLKFAKAGEIVADAVVEPIGAKGPNGLDYQPNVDGSKPAAPAAHHHRQH